MILYPTLQVMIGFAIRQYFGARWDTDIVLVALSLLSILTGIHILFQTLGQVLRAQAYDHQIAPPFRQVTVIPNLNQTYALTLHTVQIDVERAFCRALLDFPILTEAYWLKGSPSKWQSMGGVGRKDFADCKERLTRLGALARTNPNAKNSPHKVADRRILEHRANHPSPARTSPTVQKRYFQG